MKFRAYIIVGTMFVFLLFGCSGSDSDTQEQIGEYSCVATPYQGEQSPIQVRTAVLNFIPDQEVRCFDNETFSYDFGEVEFTVIEYGDLNDCPSGCIVSRLCTIYENDESQIYSAIWQTGEIPQSLDESCGDASSSGQSTIACNVQPDGFNHPVTSIIEFTDLLEDETSLFRWCN